VPVEIARPGQVQSEEAVEKLRQVRRGSRDSTRRESAIDSTRPLEVRSCHQLAPRHHRDACQTSV